MKKILLIISVALLSTTMLFGCKKEQKAENKLIVGLNAEFPPFEYIEKGEIMGFDVDLMNEIGKLLGKEVEYKHMAFDGLLLAMQTKKIDLIVSGMTATEDRRKHVDFSEPYFTSKQAILVKENSTITNFEDLQGKKIGVVLGFTGDLSVTEQFKDTAEILRYDSTGQVVLGLTQDKVDAIVIDNEPAKEYVAKNKGLKMLDTPLSQEEYSIALPKNSDTLLHDINSALVTLKNNGTYDKIYAKYFNKQ